MNQAFKVQIAEDLGLLTPRYAWQTFFTFEEVAGDTDSYFAVVAAQRLTWAINDRSTFKQENVANISVEDTDNFTLVASAQLDTALTPDLYWMIGLEYLFDNQPAPGQGEEDLSLNTGVTLRFKKRSNEPSNPRQHRKSASPREFQPTVESS